MIVAVLAGPDARYVALAMKKILVPADYSDASRSALEYALLFAESFDARVEVLHVWEMPAFVRPDLVLWEEGTEEHRKPLHEVAELRATREMDEFLRPFAAPARKRITEHVRSGDPVETIVDVATRGGADLVVMGTHGRSGLSHLVMGSVAEKVVRQAPCPVLTVRVPG